MNACALFVALGACVLVAPASAQEALDLGRCADEAWRHAREVVPGAVQRLAARGREPAVEDLRADAHARERLEPDARPWALDHRLPEGLGASPPGVSPDRLDPCPRRVASRSTGAGASPALHRCPVPYLDPRTSLTARIAAVRSDAFCALSAAEQLVAARVALRREQPKVRAWERYVRERDQALGRIAAVLRPPVSWHVPAYRHGSFLVRARELAEGPQGLLAFDATNALSTSDLQGPAPRRRREEVAVRLRADAEASRPPEGTFDELGVGATALASRRPDLGEWWVRRDAHRGYKRPQWVATDRADRFEAARRGGRLARAGLVTDPRRDAYSLIEFCALEGLRPNPQACVSRPRCHGADSMANGSCFSGRDPVRCGGPPCMDVEETAFLDFAEAFKQERLRACQVLPASSDRGVAPHLRFAPSSAHPGRCGPWRRALRARRARLGEWEAHEAHLHSTEVVGQMRREIVHLRAVLAEAGPRSLRLARFLEAPRGSVLADRIEEVRRSAHEAARCAREADRLLAVRVERRPGRGLRWRCATAREIEARTPGLEHARTGISPRAWCRAAPVGCRAVRAWCGFARHLPEALPASALDPSLPVATALGLGASQLCEALGPYAPPAFERTVAYRTHADPCAAGTPQWTRTVDAQGYRVRARLLVPVGRDGAACAAHVQANAAARWCAEDAARCRTSRRACRTFETAPEAAPDPVRAAVGRLARGTLLDATGACGALAALDALRRGGGGP